MGGWEDGRMYGLEDGWMENERIEGWLTAVLGEAKGQL